jgi:hypothetical protein
LEWSDASIQRAHTTTVPPLAVVVVVVVLRAKTLMSNNVDTIERVVKPR